MRDNLHEMSYPVFSEKKKKKNISKCRLLKILSRVLSVNIVHTFIPSVHFKL